MDVGWKEGTLVVAVSMCKFVGSDRSRDGSQVRSP